MAAAQTIRVFISSPGDVTEERDKARRVIEALERRYRGVTLEPVLWEELALPATASFQETIDYLLEQKPIDIAVFVLWSRLGSALGAAVTRSDGTPYRSGSEREFDLMLTAFEQSGRQRPVILAYARQDEAGFRRALSECAADQLEVLISQNRLAESFIREQFHDAEGRNLRAYHSYTEPVNFAQRLEVHLRHALDELVSTDTAARWQHEPYRGLQFFNVEHAAIFLGRDEECCDLLARLRDQELAGCAFVAIVGASGAGKSSLAFAGVAATLMQRNWDDDVREWRVATFLPSLAEGYLCLRLAKELGDAIPELAGSNMTLIDIANGLQNDAELTVRLSVNPAFATASESLGGVVRVLLVLDQMEELWTDRNISEKDREQFLEAVEVLAGSGHVTVLATLRSDFYPHAQKSRAFLRMKGERGHFDLLPPGAAALQQLITEPARLAGLQFEYDETTARKLDELILRDAARDPSALPLLQYVLSELYRQRDQQTGTLLLSAYDRMDGVEGALAQRATEQFNQLPDDARAALPEILPLLVTLDLDGDQVAVRRRAAMDELTATPARRTLTEALVAARFLSTDQHGGTPVASLTHESLLRSWEVITSWVWDNREHLRIRTAIEQRQKYWEDHGCEPSLLLSEGLPLEEGRMVLDVAHDMLRPSTLTYIDTSITHQKIRAARELRRRIMMKGGAVVLAVVCIMAVYAVWQAGVAVAQKTIAEEQEQLARKNEAEALKQTGIAVEQTKIAQKNFEETEKQRMIADGARMIADQKRMEAETAKEAEAKQKMIAQKNFEDAERQRVLAVIAKEGAEKAEKAEGAQRLIADEKTKEALRQGRIARNESAIAFIEQLLAVENRKEAERQAAEAVKQKGIAVENELKAVEQEKIALANAGEAERQKGFAIANAYIAEIGLADSKIRRNEFDSAREILERVRRESPQLLNWEWGRLMHLCTLSIDTFDNKAPVDSIALSPDGRRLVTGGSNGEAVIWDSGTGKPADDPDVEDGLRLANARLVHAGQRVYSVDWSANGKYLATGSDDVDGGFVQLWNAETGKREDRSFSTGTDAHTAPVLSVEFSQDGSKLLTASEDGSARVWDVASGTRIHLLAGHSNWVWDAAFSPDDKWIVTASQDGKAIVWDAITGIPNPPFSAHNGAVYSAAFAPDSLHVATGGYDRRVLMWKRADVVPYRDTQLNTERGPVEATQKFLPFDGHAGPIRSVRFSRDGQRIVSASMDNTIGLWNADPAVQGQMLMRFRGHDGAVRDVVFDRDDQVVFSASADHRIKKWDIDQYAEVRALQVQSFDGHTDAVLSAEFSQNGKQVVTASQDSTARIWDVSSGAQGKSLSEGHAFLVSSAVLFPNGRTMATSAADNTTVLWDILEGTQLRVLKGTGRNAALTITSDGRWLITGSDRKDENGADDGSSVRIWDTETGELVVELSDEENGHLNEVTAVAVSSDGTRVLSGDSRGRVKLWNWKTRALLFDLRGHAPSQRITGAAFVPGTNRALTASRDKTVVIWDIETGKEITDLILKHDQAVVGLAVRPGTHHVLTASADGQARLWDTDSATELAAYNANSALDGVAINGTGETALAVDAVNQRIHLWKFVGDNLATEEPTVMDFNDGLASAIFAPSPRGPGLLVLGGSDVQLLSLTTKETLERYAPHGGVTSANFSPDGKRIVTGSRDRIARIWDIESGADLKKFKEKKGHTDSVNSSVFSPDADGKYVLTASDDGTVKLWDAATGDVVRTFVGHAGDVNSAIFSPDGLLVLSASNDGTARLWNRESGEELVQYEGHEEAVLAARFSDDAKFIVTAGADDTARVWNRETGEPLLAGDNDRPGILSGHTARVTSAAFSPGEDPSRVVTSSEDGTVKLWELNSQKEILTLEGHTRAVTSVAFSPDGNSILTSSRDGRAILWLTTPWYAAGRPARRVAAVQDVTRTPVIRPGQSTGGLHWRP